MKWYETTFIYASYAVYSLYMLIFFGVWSEAPAYLRMIEHARAVLVSLILIYFFNPWRKSVDFSEFHRRVVFTAGIFLFVSAILGGIFHYKLPSEQ